MATMKLSILSASFCWLLILLNDAVIQLTHSSAVQHISIEEVVNLSIIDEVTLKVEDLGWSFEMLLETEQPSIIIETNLTFHQNESSVNFVALYGMYSKHWKMKSRSDTNFRQHSSTVTLCTDHLNQDDFPTSLIIKASVEQPKNKNVPVDIALRVKKENIELPISRSLIHRKTKPPPSPSEILEPASHGSQLAGGGGISNSGDRSPPQ